MPNQTVSLLESPAEINAIRDRWRTLAESTGNAFITPEWRDAAMVAYGRQTDAELQMVAAGHDQAGNLAWVLPLSIERSMGIDMIRIPGHQLGDISAPVAPPTAGFDEIADLVSELLAERLGPSTWMLDNVDTDWSIALQAAPAFEHHKVIRYQTTPLPRISIGEDGWAGFLASRSRNFRSQIGRRRRNLEKAHRVIFRQTDSADSLADDLENFFSLHDRRWNTRGGSGALTESSRKFHHVFAAAALEQNWLRLWILEIDGNPAAAWYGWRLGDTYSYYQAGFDPAWESMAIGTVMLTHTIEMAAEEGASTYDMLLGDEDYKRRFANDSRSVETIALAPQWTAAAGLLRSEAVARKVVARTPPSIKRLPMKALRGLTSKMPSGSTR